MRRHTSANPLVHRRETSKPNADATSIPGPFFSSRLFFVVDCVTDIRFLVDTGAEVSVIPPSPADRVRQLDGLVLRAANDSIINTFGTRSHTLDLGLEHRFPWLFIVAAVNSKIQRSNICLHMQVHVPFSLNPFHCSHQPPPFFVTLPLGFLDQ